MPRIRSLKPEIWLSGDVQRLSLPAVIMFIGLITQADDEGRGSADPLKLQASIFANRKGVRLRELLEEVRAQGLIVLYEHAGAPLFQLVKWRLHQRVSHPSKSEIPPPPAVAPESSGALRSPPEDSGGLQSVPGGSMDRSIDGTIDRSSEPDARADPAGSGAGDPAKRDRIRQAITTHPDLTDQEIAKRLRGSHGQGYAYARDVERIRTNGKATT